VFNIAGNLSAFITFFEFLTFWSSQYGRMETWPNASPKARGVNGATEAIKRTPETMDAEASAGRRALRDAHRPAMPRQRLD
jgi:hypothetical protein